MSEALCAPFFERYIFLRYSNFVSWFQVWFSDQFTRLLHYLWKQVCYMLHRDLTGCQSCYTIDSENDCVNERLQFVYAAIKPFVCRSPIVCRWFFGWLNTALCKCRFSFTVCGAGGIAFAFTELIEISFDFSSLFTPYFQSCSFGDHATKSFSSFLRTLSSHRWNSEIPWQYINSEPVYIS